MGTRSKMKAAPAPAKAATPPAPQPSPAEAAAQASAANVAACKRKVEAVLAEHRCRLMILTRQEAIAPGLFYEVPHAVDVVPL